MTLNLWYGYSHFLIVLLCFAGLGIFFAWRNRRAVYGIVAGAAIFAAFVYVADFGVFWLVIAQDARLDGDIALPCENAIINTNNSGTFYTCPHQSKINNTIFELPSPVYKKMPCYGCAHAYGYAEIVPQNLLSEQQRQVVIDKVMNLPETKLNSGWTLDHFIIQPKEDRWIANIQLFIEGIKQLPPSQECGWYGSVSLDLETLEILDISNIPPRSNVKC
ncbi:MAG: hypothetical protein ACREBU_10825 [Nitrososphaera sp.]